MTAQPSTLAVSRNTLRNIPEAPFQSLGIEWPQCGYLKCFETPKFWWIWSHFVQVLEVYSSVTSITVATRFKPWNLRVCLKDYVPNEGILRTVFEFNLRFFFPYLANIWDDSKVKIKITLLPVSQAFCYFFMNFIYEVFASILLNHVLAWKDCYTYFIAFL